MKKRIKKIRKNPKIRKISHKIKTIITRAKENKSSKKMQRKLVKIKRTIEKTKTNQILKEMRLTAKMILTFKMIKILMTKRRVYRLTMAKKRMKKIKREKKILGITIGLKVK
jgi:hypothetical protein